ncbi:hypothetical protein ALC53_07183, partial [Atta colombica]
DKCTNKSVNMKNYEFFYLSNLEEMLSRILNLTVNMNKFNPLHAGCYIEFPQEIKMKRVAIFKNREFSYLHYSTVLNFIGKERQAHVNLLYVEDPCNDNTRFAEELKNLAHNVESILSINVSMTDFIIDSFKFLSTSLEKLTLFRSEFFNLSAEDFDLLTRKGIFPLIFMSIYIYILTVEKLEKTELPSCELFYSSLTGDTVSESDYASAVNVLSPFKRSMNIATLKRYLKTDILLLTDTGACYYELDPVYYYTLLSNRYAQAKYIQSYDPSKPSTYLMYDVNNLRRGIGRQFMTIAKVRLGYVFKMDLKYSQASGKREDKLLTTLYDKKYYVIHYRNLQQCTCHGLRIAKVHHILLYSCNLFMNKLMNNAVFGKIMVSNSIDTLSWEHYKI